MVGSNNVVRLPGQYAECFSRKVDGESSAVDGADHPGAIAVAAVLGVNCELVEIRPDDETEDDIQSVRIAWSYPGGAWSIQKFIVAIDLYDGEGRQWKAALRWTCPWRAELCRVQRAQWVTPYPLGVREDGTGTKWLKVQGEHAGGPLSISAVGLRYHFTVHADVQTSVFPPVVDVWSTKGERVPVAFTRSGHQETLVVLREPIAHDEWRLALQLDVLRLPATEPIRTQWVGSQLGEYLKDHLPTVLRRLCTQYVSAFEPLSPGLPSNPPSFGVWCGNVREMHPLPCGLWITTEIQD